VLAGNAMPMDMPDTNGSAPYYDFNTTRQSLNLTINQLKDAITDLNKTVRMTYQQVLGASQQKILAPVMQSAFKQAQEYLQSPLPTQNPVYTTPGILPAIGAPLATAGLLKAKGTSYVESAYYGQADVAMRGLQLANIPVDLYRKLMATVIDVMAWNVGSLLLLPFTMAGSAALNYGVGQFGEALKLSARLGHLTMQRGARIAPMMMSNSRAGYGLRLKDVLGIGPELQRELFDIANSKDIEKLYTAGIAYGYFDFSGTKKEIKRRMHTLVKHYKEAQSTLRVSLEEYVALMRDLKLHAASDERISQVFNEIRTAAFATGQSPQQAAGVAIMGERLFKQYTWGNKPGTGVHLMSYFTFQNAPHMNLTPQGAHWTATHGGPNTAAAQQLQAIFQFANTDLGSVLMAKALTPSGTFDAQKLMYLLQHPEQWATGGSDQDKERVMQALSKIRSGDIRFSHPEALRLYPYATVLAATSLAHGNPFAAQQYLMYKGQYVGAVPDIWAKYNQEYTRMLKKLEKSGMSQEEAANLATQYARASLKNFMEFQDITFHSQTMRQAFSQVSPWGKVPILWYVPQVWHWTKRQITSGSSYLEEYLTDLMRETFVEPFNEIREIARRHTLKDIVEGKWNRNRTLRRFMEQHAFQDMRYWLEQKKSNKKWVNTVYGFSKEIAEHQGITWNEKEFTPGQATYMSLEMSEFAPIINRYREITSKGATVGQIAEFEEQAKKKLMEVGYKPAEAAEAVRRWFPIVQQQEIKDVAQEVLKRSKEESVEESERPGTAKNVKAPPTRESAGLFQLHINIGDLFHHRQKKVANQILYKELVKIMNEGEYQDLWRGFLKDYLDVKDQKVKHVDKVLEFIQAHASSIDPKELARIQALGGMAQGKFTAQTLLNTGSSKSSGFAEGQQNTFIFSLGQVSQGGLTDSKSIDQSAQELIDAIKAFVNAVNNETKK